MTGETFAEDPHPELPRCFADSERVEELSGVSASEPETASGEGITLEEITGANSVGTAEKPDRWQPQRVFRTCVATLRDVYGLGPLMAVEAQRRGFYQASRRVFVGDGQEANWRVHRLHFPNFTAVTDFMHVVGTFTEPRGFWAENSSTRVT